MNEREKISHYFAAGGIGADADRLLDLASAVRSGRPYAVSAFMTPAAGQIATTITAHFPDLVADEYGGYVGAERSKIMFRRADYDGDTDWGIGAVRAEWDARYRLVGHRDVLGSLIGLGLERDVFGDIIMQGATAQVIVDTPLVAYLMNEWTHIANVGVTVTELALTDIVPKEETCKELRATVASLRLDAVGAAGFGISRSKMAAAVAAEKVRVNWQRAKGPAQMLAVGDVISFRGRGRLVLAELTGTSRKGRAGVRLERYL